MIVRDHLPWLRVWPLISRKLGFLFLFDVTISVMYVFGDAKFLALPSLPLGMLGAALSLFLAFRTKSAYDRWWEARTLWGGLVNTSRTLARQALTLILPSARVPDPDELRRDLVTLQIAYVHALRCHLRGQNPWPELRNLLPVSVIPEIRSHSNVPAAIVLAMARLSMKAQNAGCLDSYRWMAIDASLTDLMNIQGGCERIKNTPMPKQYDYFPRVLVTFLSVLLPIGLVDGLGLLTPVASTLLSFIFITLDTIGRDIETPFDNTVHDTPMTSLSRTIEINLRQALAAASPREVTAVSGFVY